MGRKGIRALIVAPTRELALQTEEFVRNYGRHVHLRCATIYGGVGENPQIAALRSGIEIVVATPGRLLDLMRRGLVNFSQMEVAVLDEADRMLDMGFLPDIRQIVRALPPERQTLLFSATLSKEIEALTAEFLKNPHLVQIGRRSNPAETVTQFVYEVPKSRKVSLLLHLLRDKALDSVLVFSRTKHGADKIARKLEQSGIATATLHSNRSQGQRLQALRAFKSGAVRVLVATDIAARGIDVEGISHVVNFDFPPQPEDYVHRIGRTGRAHAVGDAISFITPDDHGSLRAVERFIARGIPRKRAGDFDYSERPQPLAAFSETPRPAKRGEGGAPRVGSRQAPRRVRGHAGGNRRPSSAPSGHLLPLTREKALENAQRPRNNQRTSRRSSRRRPW
jgi:ATP-dependent RNA helicase RhlE